MGKLTDNQFLFGFEGRINRAKYWYALFASMTFCMVFMGLAAFVISLIFGATVKSIHVQLGEVFGIPKSLPFSATFSGVDSETSALVTLLFYIAATPIFVIGIWFLFATTIKRLHDRDKSGWWIIIFFAAPALLGRLVDRIDGESFVATGFAITLAVAALSLYAWGFVELLFLKGSREPNRFGPDPLARAIPDRSWSARSDQHIELKFVPPGAGPPPGPHVMRGT
jgi:uncharacterized membrane protein YhaH (DUF805 family)